MTRSGSKTGLTLIELMIVVGLLAIIVAKITIVLKEASDAHRRESATIALEDQAYRVLDKISYAIIGSDPGSLFPNALFPFSSPELEYKVSMGVEDGEIVWSDPEIIGLTGADNSQLFWAQNQGEVDERFVVWCNTVSEYLQDELQNGSDDNSNGLTDEDGLSFVLDRSSVTIRLTLERKNKAGDPIQKTVETTVTCRN